MTTIKYRVETILHGSDSIELITYQTLSDDSPELRLTHETSRKICKLHEEATRNALMALGWTPPGSVPLTNSNQYPFEVVRDIATVLLRLEPNESCQINVARHKQTENSELYDWGCNVRNLIVGTSYTANAMQEAYKSAQKGKPEKEPLPTEPPVKPGE